MTVAAPTDKRRPFDPATRKPRGKSRHVIVEAKGVDAERYPWFKAFREANIPDGPKAVGFSLSTYGDNDGSRNFPGIARLAAAHHCDERTIYRHLQLLIKAGWIRKAREYRAGVNRTFADEYQLTIPDTTISPEEPGEDRNFADPDDWHLREPDDEPEDYVTNLSPYPDDYLTDLTRPGDKDVRPPTEEPTNRGEISRADRRSAPGRGAQGITAHAATDEGVKDSPDTPRTKRPSKRKPSQVTPEGRAECDRYIALIPRLSFDGIGESLDLLYDSKYGIWEWAHDEMRKQYKEPTSKEADVGDPETLEKARFMMMKALRCSSRNPVLEDCLTEPLDAVDGA